MNIRFPSPSEIKEVVREPYSLYLSGLEKNWLAARHPDVDGRGRPRRRTLSKPERTELMETRLNELAEMIPEGRWHSDCYSPRSSQAFGLLVLGSLAKIDAFSLLVDDLSIGSSPRKIKFEVQSGRSNLDAVLIDDHDKVLAVIEVKFTEEGFGTCNYPNDERCDGQWLARPHTRLGCPMASAGPNWAYAKRYWDIVRSDWGLAQDPPLEPCVCPLWAAYQAVHNLAETRHLSPGAWWILIYDARNPYFSDGRVGWVNLLSRWGTQQWHSISWQGLISRISKQAPDLFNDIRALHGF